MFAVAFVFIRTFYLKTNRLLIVMKKLSTKLLVFLFASLTLSSCMKSGNNDDYLRQIEEEKQRIDLLMRTEKPIIESYVMKNLPTAEVDTVNFPLQQLGIKIQRGIWYQVIAPATDNSYEYKLTNNGYNVQVKPPIVKLKYTVKMLDGTVILQDKEGSTYDFSSNNNAFVTYAVTAAFYPYTLKLNGESFTIFGLTKDGLKKGSKFRIVTPSLWAYGNRAVTIDSKSVPANTPLDYEFEVLNIE